MNSVPRCSFCKKEVGTQTGLAAFCSNLSHKSICVGCIVLAKSILDASKDEKILPIDPKKEVSDESDYRFY